MSVGFSTTKNDIDSRAGGLAVDVRNKLAEVQNFKLRLDAVSDAELSALGYTGTDIARLRSAFVDLDRLAQIYLGLAAQTPAYDFRAFAKFLTGVA